RDRAAYDGRRVELTTAAVPRRRGGLRRGRHGRRDRNPRRTGRRRTRLPRPGAPRRRGELMSDRHAFPVASSRRTVAAARSLIRTDGRALLGVVLLNCLAAVAGLAGPWLLARIVDE